MSVHPVPSQPCPSPCVLVLSRARPFTNLPLIPYNLLPNLIPSFHHSIIPSSHHQSNTPTQEKSLKRNTHTAPPSQHTQMLRHALLPRANLHAPENTIVRARRRLQALPLPAPPELADPAALTTHRANGPRGPDAPRTPQPSLDIHFLFLGKVQRRRDAPRFPAPLE